MRESAMRRAASCVSGVSCAKRSKLSSPIKAHRHGGAQTWHATVGLAHLETVDRTVGMCGVFPSRSASQFMDRTVNPRHG